MPIFDGEHKQTSDDLVASNPTALMCFCSKIVIITISITLKGILEHKAY